MSPAVKPSVEAAPLRRPGGRSTRVQQAVYRAVTSLLSDGTEEITIPVIAARAGVNPTSVYRRWGDLDALREEVAVAVLTEAAPIPDTGSLRRDLTIWAQFLATDISRPERVAFLRALVGSLRDDGGTVKCSANREGQIAEILSHAHERGESTPDVAQVMDQVVAPLYYAVLFGRAGADAAHATTLVDRLFCR